MENNTQASFEPIKYGLKAIHQTSFTLNRPKTPFNAEQVQVDYKVNPIIKYNVKGDEILVLMEINCEIKETSEVILKSETAFEFRAKDLSMHLTQLENGSWQFINPQHNNLLASLIGVSLSTSRGILFEKTKGSILEDNPIPVVNPAIFLEKK